MAAFSATVKADPVSTALASVPLAVRQFALQLLSPDQDDVSATAHSPLECLAAAARLGCIGVSGLAQLSEALGQSWTGRALEAAAAAAACAKEGGSLCPGDRSMLEEVSARIRLALAEHRMREGHPHGDELLLSGGRGDESLRPLWRCLCMAHALKKREAGQPEAALRLLSEAGKTEAVASWPRPAWLLRQMAACNMALEDWPSAAALADEALQLDRDSAGDPASLQASMRLRLRISCHSGSDEVLVANASSLLEAFPDPARGGEELLGACGELLAQRHLADRAELLLALLRTRPKISATARLFHHAELSVKAQKAEALAYQKMVAAEEGGTEAEKSSTEEAAVAAAVQLLGAAPPKFAAEQTVVLWNLARRCLEAGLPGLAAAWLRLPALAALNPGPMRGLCLWMAGREAEAAVVLRCCDTQSLALAALKLLLAPALEEQEQEDDPGPRSDQQEEFGSATNRPQQKRRRRQNENFADVKTGNAALEPKRPATELPAAAVAAVALAALPKAHMPAAISILEALAAAAAKDHEMDIGALLDLAVAVLLAIAPSEHPDSPKSGVQRVVAALAQLCCGPRCRVIFERLWNSAVELGNGGRRRIAAAVFAAAQGTAAAGMQDWPGGPLTCLEDGQMCLLAKTALQLEDARRAAPNRTQEAAQNALLGLPTAKASCGAIDAERRRQGSTATQQGLQMLLLMEFELRMLAHDPSLVTFLAEAAGAKILPSKCFLVFGRVAALAGNRDITMQCLCVFLRSSADAAAAGSLSESLGSFAMALRELVTSHGDLEATIGCFEEVLSVLKRVPPQMAATFPPAELRWLIAVAWKNGARHGQMGNLPAAKRWIGLVGCLLDFSPEQAQLHGAAMASAWRVCHQQAQGA